MAKKEKPVVDNDTGKIKVKAKKENQPTSNETKGNVTVVKAKMKQGTKDLETITKVDLDKIKKPEEKNETKETNTHRNSLSNRHSTLTICI